MAQAPHVLFVVAPYYTEIVAGLVDGAARELEAAGVTWERVDVAGAFELPTAIAMAIEAGAAGGRRYDGYVALGCVIRGETSHYDHICNEVSRALMALAVEHRLPLGFGLLTCENGDQARARSDPARKNKGGEAARACLSLLEARNRFGLTAKA